MEIDIRQLGPAKAKPLRGKDRPVSAWELYCPTNAMHTDSAITLRFHIEDQWRGAGDGDRWAATL